MQTAFRVMRGAILPDIPKFQKKRLIWGINMSTYTDVFIKVYKSTRVPWNGTNQYINTPLNSDLPR